MCSCDLAASLKQTLELFHACTQLPISALAHNGSVMGRSGLNGEAELPMAKLQPYLEEMSHVPSWSAETGTPSSSALSVPTGEKWASLS